MPDPSILRRHALRFGPALLLLVLTGRPASAQFAPSDFFKERVLVLAGGGHHAPVRSMVFPGVDGSLLLTGGMDKAIHLWNLNGDMIQSSRTLRPPQWRASRGQVNALALASRPDAEGHRILAVAGYGVLGDLGEVLLFRYPGAGDRKTGEIVGQLCGLAAVPDSGHTDTITALAFTPDGRLLASASNDKTVRIWDVEARRTVAVLREATLAVNALAIFGNGTRLAAGGADGTLRVYDITNRARPPVIAQAPPIPSNPADPLSGSINALAVTPDNRWAFVGTEGHLLIRFDLAANLAATVLPNNVIPGVAAGPVEALAISPDGTRLATSTIARNLASPADPPVFACAVDLREVPSGRLLERVADTTDLVHAVAFSPDGRRLAFSGGDAQSVYFRDLAPGSRLVTFPGQGTSIWDVGVRADGQAIRYSRARTDLPGRLAPGADFEAFDLRRRARIDPAPDEAPYQHARPVAAGWTIRPAGFLRLDFVNARNQAWNVSLDLRRERRWYCYTVIPGDAAALHPDPVAAVGCATGVVLWNLTTGQVTRSFAGHEAPVYCLAPSPDGKWLVTGSADQTVRLWPLAGCDRRPPFGARFARQADGRWSVAEVTPGGYADAIKLRKGHVIEAGFLNARPMPDLAAFLASLDALPPADRVDFYARMPGEPDQFREGNTKRDSPALTLFSGIDREWVIWTPRGDYDTSIVGDRKYLGWLTNQGSPGRLEAGTFDTIDRFEPKFRQKRLPDANVLDRLLDTGDPGQARLLSRADDPGMAGPERSGLKAARIGVAPPGAPIPAVPDPAVPDPAVPNPVAAAPPFDPVPEKPIVATQPVVPFDYRVLIRKGAAKIAELAIEANGRIIASNLLKGQPVEAAAGRVQVPLDGAKDVEVTLRIKDETGVERKETAHLSNQAPPDPARRGSRLEILALGAEAPSGPLPGIPYARADADDLSNFLKDRLIDPATNARFPAGRGVARRFVDRELDAARLTAALDELRKDVREKTLGNNDVVAVVIESHFFVNHSEKFIATADPGPARTPNASPPSISADDLADRLGELARAGCRVVVLIDAIHDLKKTPWGNDINDWIRRLQDRSRVVTFIASTGGPSREGPGGHRLFAGSILDAPKPRAAGLLRPRAGPMSLFEFSTIVTNSVKENSGRRQFARCYPPDTIRDSVLFLDPSEIAPPEPQPAAALLRP